MKHLCLGIGALLLAAGVANAQTGYTITGAMSNFDCSNHCDYDCDEMEIEIQGIHPEDVMHTYHNGNYGSPTVTLSPDGASTIIDYRNPQHLTAVNSIEHFGVTIRGAAYYVPAPYHPTRIHWYRDGHIATVGGQVPNPTGGGSAPSTQPLQPSISSSITAGSHGTGGVSLTVTNNDPVQSIWIKRRAQVTASLVTLEALMPDNPLVTTTVQIDPSPIKLGPAQTLTANRDLLEVEEDQSVVFAAQYYQNIIVQHDDPFDPTNGESFGPELGNIMTATQASPQLPCDHHPSFITSQPGSVTQDEGTRVDLRVNARGDDIAPQEFQWFKEGVALSDGNGISGSTTSHLRINSLRPSDEGFYTVTITNACAHLTSDSALVFITGHNLPPQRPIVECPAITAQSPSGIACAGTPFTFAVSATGTTPTYQWRVAKGGLAAAPIAGAQSAVLTLASTLASDSGLYDCVISNSCGSVVTNAVSLLVNSADFNNDGDTGTDLDIEAFFACLAGNCCATCGTADFNADGDTGTDLDIEAFFRVLSGGPC